MFDYQVVNSALDNLLVSGSEIFIDFSIKRGARKLPQSFFLVEVGPPNNQSAAFVGRFGKDLIIFTMDITSLYTVIPNGEGLLALKHFFDLRTVKEPGSETLLRLAELVLTLNCFSFADSYCKEINGVAMGTKMGPSYANLFVGYIEHKFFNQYNGPKPELYRRYIDDCVGATSSTREVYNCC